MRAAIVVAVTLLTVSGQYRPAAAVVAAPNAVATQASPLWDAPVGGARPDLFAGPWGNGSAPDPAAVYTFLRNKQGGANPGVVVRAPHGRVWHVKQAPSSGDRGDEGPVEVVLSRVLSAIGYHQPPVYYVRSFTMRDGKRVHQEPGGRFRLNEASLHDRGPWSWRESSIVGTRPYNGLLFVLLVFNSWDLKDSNNRIYDVRQNDGVTSTWYVVRDLGGALGESGTLRPKRNNIETFEEERFIKGISH